MLSERLTAQASQVMKAAIFGPSEEAYERYRWLREHAPVFFDPSLGAFVVSNYRDCQFVLQHDELFRSPREGELLARKPGEATEILQHFIVNTGGDKHRRLRSAMVGALSPVRMRLMREKIEQTVGSLVEAAGEALRAGGVVDFHEAISLPLPLTVVGDFIGVPRPDRGRLHEIAKTLFRDPTATPEEDRQRVANLAEVTAYFDTLLEERRRAPQEDLISTLLGWTAPTVPEDKRLTQQEVRMLCYVMQIAGYDTTVSCIDNLVAALLENPDLFAQLGDDRSATRFIDETLRWSCTAKTSIGVRFANQDQTLSGVHVPRDAELYLVLGATHRDPQMFSAPDALAFDRRGGPPLTFGAGVHYCVGAPLAKLEMLLLFRAVHDRLPGLRAAGPSIRSPTPALVTFSSIPVRLAEAAAATA